MTSAAVTGKTLVVHPLRSLRILYLAFGVGTFVAGFIVSALLRYSDAWQAWAPWVWVLALPVGIGFVVHAVGIRLRLEPDGQTDLCAVTVASAGKGESQPSQGSIPDVKWLSGVWPAKQTIPTIIAGAVGIVIAGSWRS